MGKRRESNVSKKMVHLYAIVALGRCCTQKLIGQLGNNNKDPQLVVFARLISRYLCAMQSRGTQRQIQAQIKPEVMGGRVSSFDDDDDDYEKKPASEMGNFIGASCCKFISQIVYNYLETLLHCLLCVNFARNGSKSLGKFGTTRMKLLPLLYAVAAIQTSENGSETSRV